MACREGLVTTCVQRQQNLSEFHTLSGGRVLGWLIQPTWHTFKEPIVFSNVFRGLCAGEADSADLAHIERNKVFRAFSRGCVLGWLIQPTWHTFKEPIVF